MPLDNLTEFVQMVVNQRDVWFPSMTGVDPFSRKVRDGEVYCPTCGDKRRVEITIHFARNGSQPLDLNPPKVFHDEEAPPYTQPRYGIPRVPPQIPTRIETDVTKNTELLFRVPLQISPALFTLQCLQCSLQFTALLYQSGDIAFSVAIFASREGGLTTPHTPRAVSYYLDQAYKAQTVGASSAAMAMYRAGLEHLLFDQGYTSSMLGPKITCLEADIQRNTAKPWARDLNREFLTVIKRLGDGAIHPNDGDISKQAAFDSGLLTAVQLTMMTLLEAVYERPYEEESRVRMLSSAASQFRRPQK